MTEQLKRGDRVEWTYRGTTVRGKVMRKLTAPADVGGRRANASPADPRYVVRSEKTGKEAAHRAAVLRPVSG
jgi:Hypervirulence associated proteins TUDOR domain